MMCPEALSLWDGTTSEKSRSVHTMKLLDLIFAYPTVFEASSTSEDCRIQGPVFNNPVQSWKELD